MSEHESNAQARTTRRRFLGRAAATTGLVWAAPSVLSLNPAVAGSAAPQGEVCRQQTLVGSPTWEFGLGYERDFDFDLGVAFASVSSITVRLTQADGGIIQPDCQFSVTWANEPYPPYTGSFGVQQYGQLSAPNPFVCTFAPSGGAVGQTYSETVQDGKARVVVYNESSGPNQAPFSLSSVQLEVCGILA